MASPPDRFARHTTFRLSTDLDNQQSPRASFSSMKDRVSTLQQDGELPPNENSPLLTAQSSDSSDTLQDDHLLDPDETGQKWVVPERSTLFLIILTLSIGGLQIAWSVELSNGSPYLLSLGMSKSFMALVWIAGPLSGTLVQPYVGIRSDNCRLKWGKRRPFMVGGAIATIISLLVLGWTREIVGVFFGTESKTAKAVTMFVAVLFVYVLDFAINVVQAGIRAFIVDNAPMHQQDSANAWASRMTGIGNVVGYVLGFMNLPRLVPWIGDTQFKVLCFAACVALGGTVGISCLWVKERNPQLDPSREKGDESSLIGFFRRLMSAIRRLPPQVRKVCEAQFFAWIGWFPFLFYITTYIGEIYTEPFYEANPNMTPEEEADLHERGTRVGTLALVVFAVVSLSSNILLPFFVRPSFEAPQRLHSASLGNGEPTEREKPSVVTRFLEKIQIRWLTLRRAWILSHLLFFLAMQSTFLVRSTGAATVMVAACGVSWALTLWAPFALISAEIAKRDSIRRGLMRSSRPSTPAAAMPTTPTSPSTSRHAGPGSYFPPVGEPLEQRPEDGYEDQAGIILGLHNVAVAAPQILATIMSSALFRLLEKKRGEGPDTSLAWVLRVGGLAALAAAWVTRRVAEEGRRGGVLAVEVEESDVDWSPDQR